MNDSTFKKLEGTSIFKSTDENVPARRALQYGASLAATLGALATGLTLGWSTAAGPDGTDLAAQYNIPISPNEFSWIGSLPTLGCAVICCFAGFLVDSIGRKRTMLLMVVPFTIGWLLIIFANSVTMLCIGRFVTGISGGSFCITIPIYTAEIAEKEIRGTLGSYFQLFNCLGVLTTYILGTLVTLKELSIISAIVPIIFFVVFAFMPETPVYYLKKGDERSARDSLIRFRGNLYDIDSELETKKAGLTESNEMNYSCLTILKSKATVTGFVITFGLMVFQQFCGVNTIVFYSSDIFAKAASSIKPSDSIIILGVVQTIGVLASSQLVDRAGRRILLLISMTFLFLATFIIGTYFYLQHVQVNVHSVSWLPLVCVGVFMAVFNLGCGTIPWLLAGEVFAPEVRGIGASSSGFLSWLLAFIITKFYVNLKAVIQIGGTFWLYSGFCAIGIIFVYFIVPETKGKSLEQIQEELSM